MTKHDFVFLTADLPGVFVFDRNRNIIACSLFPKDGKKIGERIEELNNGKKIDELLDVLDRVNTENIVTDLPFDLEEFNVEVKDNLKVSEYLSSNLRDISKQTGFVADDSEYNRIISKYFIQQARENIKKSVEKDKVAAQAVSAINDLDDVANEFNERLREWYGLYYPELKINSNEKFAREVASKGERERFNKYKGSMGIDLDKDDIDAIRSFANQLKQMYETKDQLEDYLEGLMKTVAPNLSYVIGAKLAAGLVSLAGSLEKLSKMPSSKIQLLGAEKALFRHLHGGGKPPKYGIIYTHRYIQKTPEGKRGKVARAIASKLMMASRTDYYTNKFKGDKYREELEKKIEEIRAE